MPEFREAMPLDRLRPADYNPRRLSEEAFARLQRSLDLFGCVKPVIVNKTGVLVAGHQRTKSLAALGVREVPAIVLDQHVKLHDEIRFNLLHNSVETDTSTVRVPACPEDVHGWSWLEPDLISVRARAGVAMQSEIRRLITRYGAWGSIVADHAGRVILNQDYAVVCRDLRVPLLVYRVSVQEADELIEWLDGEYGVYDYSGVDIKAYNQHKCQMHRLAGEDGASNRSSTYERHVLPLLATLSTPVRIVDFGAGEAAYIKRLRAEGHDAHWYEPHVRTGGTAGSLDVAASVSQIRDLQRDVPARGLYDVVVLDSVINSITSLEFEEFVLTACNSLLSEDGVFVTGTRSLGSVQQKQSPNRTRMTSQKYRCALDFLDENNFSATFQQGVWTMQRYHTKASLRELMLRFFGEVEVKGSETGGNIYAVCRRPRALSPERRRAALECEFNMEYPGGYRHNRHKPLVRALMEACAIRDAEFAPNFPTE
ncbi:ParB N-terminal domain-containing protein (plasmid) [Streptomyces sp. BI20]|uniref:ParB N-terminal domain-containing protein n=1 Tax=Streptomyces sp. BI20 TaxID=3403460 RepID=UPI003C721BBF